MIPPAWLLPPTAAAGATWILAVDSTTLSVAVIGAVQAVIVAGLAWRQARDRIRADRTSVELKAGAEVQTAKITSAQQLIDQLMTQSTADRTLIATLQTELAELTADHRRLDRTLTQVLSGAHRLHAQVVDMQAVPVWSPDRLFEGD